MKKRYLKTVEDVLALKDTNTKIYSEHLSGYYQFVNGVFCAFDDNGCWLISTGLDEREEPYILEEEPMQEATEADIGKLCKFWEDDSSAYYVGILDEISEEDTEQIYCMECAYGCWFKNCRPITLKEVEELTGYKVEEKIK